MKGGKLHRVNIAGHTGLHVKGWVLLYADLTDARISGDLDLSNSGLEQEQMEEIASIGPGVRLPTGVRPALIPPTSKSEILQWLDQQPEKPIE